MLQRAPKRFWLKVRKWKKIIRKLHTIRICVDNPYCANVVREQ